MSFRLLLRCTLTTTLLAACGQADDGTELGVARQAMFSGAPSDASYGGVVFLETRQNADNVLSCTGTLIAPNLVVTALHCVTSAVLEDVTFTCRADGSLSADQVRKGTLGPLVPAANVKVYAGSPVEYSAPAAIGAQLFGTGSTQVCQADLALLKLDRSLELPVAHVRLDRMASWKETVNVLGYGQTETGNNGGLRMMRQVDVIDVGPSSTAEPPRTASPRTFVIGEGPCKGDSGGPAFSEATGALLGVFSLNTADTCDSIGIHNVYTSLSPFSKLILDTFDTVGAEPLLEPGTSLDESEPEENSADSGGCMLSQRRPAQPSWAIALFGAALAGLALRRRRS